MGERRARIAIAAAAVLSAVVAALELRSGFTPWLLACWLAVVALLAAAAGAGGAIAWVAGRCRERPGVAAGAAALLVLPLLVRLANVSLAFAHPDEFALAWFSTQYRVATTDFFGPIPPEAVWTFQSPSPYFVVQKLVLAVIGATPLDVKLSALPWVLITAGALFLAARALFDTAAAAVAVVVYAFLAPSVYAESFAIPNTMSTALLTLFLLCALHAVRWPTLRSAVVVGLACAFCYLAYVSSYAAAPLLVAFAAVAWWHVPGKRIVKSVAISLGTCAIALVPFLAGAAKSSDYFVERISQTVPVARRLLGREVDSGEVSASLSRLPENWALDGAYFWRDDIGGTGGFEFGHRALLDRVSLGFLAAGVLLAPGMARRRRELLLLALVAAVNVAGLGFANPPPHITRLANLFPLVAVFVALPITAALRVRQARPALRSGLALVLLAAVVWCNVGHLRAAQARDLRAGREDSEDVKVAVFLKERFPGKEIRVAAFDGFQLEYALHFFMPAAKVVTDYHDELLKRPDLRADCVYVILFPGEFNARFEAACPGSTLITNVSRKYSILVTRAGG